MEFADLILAPKIESVSLLTPFKVKIEGPLCITGHHMIVSSNSKLEDGPELWVGILLKYASIVRMLSVLLIKQFFYVLDLALKRRFNRKAAAKQRATGRSVENQMQGPADS